MKTYLVHHTPMAADQDTWAVSFSLPYIAYEYAPVSAGLWYVKTWLSAEQIKRRLAILFDQPDELAVHELGRADADLAARLHWMQGRLEDDEPATWQSPRVWTAFQSAIHAIARPLS
jgi:hypothetical protein